MIKVIYGAKFDDEVMDEAVLMCLHTGSWSESLPKLKEAIKIASKEHPEHAADYAKTVFFAMTITATEVSNEQAN